MALKYPPYFLKYLFFIFFSYYIYARIVPKRRKRSILAMYREKKLNRKIFQGLGHSWRRYANLERLKDIFSFVGKGVPDSINHRICYFSAKYQLIGSIFALTLYGRTPILISRYCLLFLDFDLIGGRQSPGNLRLKLNPWNIVNK